MSHRAEEKLARRQERERREAEARARAERARRLHRIAIVAVALVSVAFVALAVSLGGGSSDGTRASSAEQPPGPLAAGSQAPEFSALDVVSGKQVTLDSLKGQKTLLFFSEGVYCQACMVQSADLENSSELARAGIRVVSVTTDPPKLLKEAAAEYGIETPLLSDESTAMSSAYGMLGRGGMGHPDTNGHAFMLLDERGRIVWDQEYQEMYVDTTTLMRAIPG